MSREVAGVMAAVWGAAGLMALLGFAVARLTAVVLDGLDADWQWMHVATAAANAVFMAWSEGYRGFQLRLSPRGAARVKWLLENPSALRIALAPLFVLSYFGAPRRRIVATYALTLGIVVAIVLLHALPQPWRAALDIGVVIGLAWGMASFAWSLLAVLGPRQAPVSPEIGNA